MLCLSFVVGKEDEGLGLVDVSLFEDQTLMELLVSHMDGQKVLKDGKGHYRRIQEWRGVSMSECGRVYSIDWSRVIAAWGFFLLEKETLTREVAEGGTIDTHWIPSEVRSFQIGKMQLSGTVNTKSLPQKLRTLNITENAFSGTFAIETLPQDICYINLSSNFFSGSLNFLRLPWKVEEFHASNNAFSGSLQLSHLPDFLKALHLNTNQFSGEIELQKIPRTLIFLDLHDNHLAQETLLVGKSRKAFRLFYVDDESFSKISFSGLQVNSFST